MSILEATYSMLAVLPEEDVQAIHDITYRFYVKTSSPFKPLTHERVMEDLAVSRNQIEEGRYKDLDAAIWEIRSKYGL